MARRTSQGVVDGGSTLPSRGTAQPVFPPVEAGEHQRPATREIPLTERRMVLYATRPKTLSPADPCNKVPAHQSHPACLRRARCLKADVCRAHSRRRTLARDPDHRVRAKSTQGNPRGDRHRFRRAQCAGSRRAPIAFIQQPTDLTPAAPGWDRR